MTVNPVAENVLGTIGTICWTVQLIPQIWKSFRTKSTDGLSEWLVLLWGISGVFLGTYNVVRNFNIPLIIQPHLFYALSLTSWGQCQYYGRRRSATVALAMCIGIMAICAGFEVGMIFALRPAYEEGRTGSVKAFGILFSVFVAIGLLPEYYEIWKKKEVIGISITFMLIDAAGGIFSDLSLAFAPEFDIAAAVGYTLVTVMDMVVVVAALILNPRAKRQRQLMESNEPSMENVQDQQNVIV